MKKEKPIKVMKYPAKRGAKRHDIETRVFAREIHETFCTDKKCEFYGQHAVQGVCYSNKPDVIDWKRVEKQEKQLEEELAYIKKKYKGKAYLSWLESMYHCAQMNWTFTLDELIRLRRDVALLKLQLKKRK
jgi:hypothetical protein